MMCTILTEINIRAVHRLTAFLAELAGCRTWADSPKKANTSRVLLNHVHVRTSRLCFHRACCCDRCRR
ncbi:hypothetical protein L210DRAFT_3564689 [Boletus edulis BED1]|uniref:Uncharacterized protein n=1 Tax=Boletus edulis BED1 TaxID=1328754 RepID=A0AAD4BGP7_BOLED|nr:hypothetical protein L210DRAFT_3564689 [Boletus edulis BED1]